MVIGGLILVKIGEWVPGLAFLHRADAVAAMVVAGIVVYVSVQLGIRTIHGLLDTAPKGLADKIKDAVENLFGVIDCHNIRVRYSGPQVFVDAHVLVNPELTIVEAHDLTEKIEATIHQIVPGADITVHPEPGKKMA